MAIPPPEVCAEPTPDSAPTVRIELQGSDTALFNDIVYVGGKHDPVPPLVRRLLAEGLINGGDLVDISRNGRSCFQLRPAEEWADIDVVETQTGGPRRVKAYVGPHAPGYEERTERFESLKRARAQ